MSAQLACLNLARFIWNCARSHGHTLVYLTATLVERATANHLEHRLPSALAGPLVLAAFGERQLVAKNLQAAERIFQPDDQRRPVHGGHKKVVVHELS
jgi:predicted short-subunit dehydrogenase-like oxidoreductase (DUF2520 family)